MSPMQTQPKDSATILAFERQQATFLLQVHKVLVRGPSFCRAASENGEQTLPERVPTAAGVSLPLPPGSVSAEPAVTVKIPDPVKGS